MVNKAFLGVPYPSSVNNASFKQAVFPTSEKPVLTLYKYVDCYALRQILRNGTLKVTFREDSNDPYELLPYGENPQESSENRDLGFLCFSGLNDAPSLWGNYAAKYTGACLEFKVPFFFYEGSGHRGLSPYGGIWSTTAFLSHCLGVEIYFVSLAAEWGTHVKIDLHGGGVVVKCLYTDQRVNLGKLQNFAGMPDESFLRQAAETILPLVAKDKGWERESEYRAIFRRGCCAQEGEKFFVSDYMRFMNRIIITEKAGIGKEEIEAMLVQTPNLRRKVSVLQASFSNTTFRLNIPKEYKNGVEVDINENI